ncbi:hypothetical protein N7E81_03550 [Reichenbachiella carrageenanivorans]|uniref:Deoxyribose-phosphate aldolase n=1 Tax=Reichenbachiella carrageenanivorans TaxID=2979869 RepID=A0ABY6D3H2_9BACT|nr:DUF6503 family protein [Reichenbachiella carrageenanivorans]UXX80175.1 hypothetical protein N7E81_03550 [Reichenbachiella carrageenanivorans]
MKKLLFIFLSISAFACTPSKKPQKIIDQTIAAHGGQLFEGRTVTFDFRDKHYLVQRKKGSYTYIRAFEQDSVTQVKDVLVNSTELERYINDTLQVLSDEMKVKYANSVNSVLYFFQLPYGLNDPAVVKKYLGQKVINKHLYDKVRVTFKQDNGGEDFEDVFVYWINVETGLLDYLAYSYLTDGGGVRFRQAVNRRTIEGMVFQDYINFKPARKDVEVQDLDQAFIEASLIELSQIENENIAVR